MNFILIMPLLGGVLLRIFLGRLIAEELDIHSYGCLCGFGRDLGCCTCIFCVIRGGLWRNIAGGTVVDTSCTFPTQVVK